MEINKKTLIVIFVIFLLIGSLSGGAMGFLAGTLTSGNADLAHWVRQNILCRKEASLQGQSEGAEAGQKIVKMDEESAVIAVVKNVSPAVVSIIITKDLPIVERYYSDPFGGNDFFKQFFGDNFGDFFGFGTPRYRQKGTAKREVGGGTGFLLSADGYIVTNKHVVADKEAEYTVLMNDESRHEAEVLARDPVNDLAILKIKGDNFPYVDLGDSSGLKVGQSVIAIGNALGEFRNTVSTGVISGLSRSVTAGGYGVGSEQLFGVIQTDASINPGNSGGPLLNLAGQVIGINTAMASGAQNIGFALPINAAKGTIESVRKNGRIVRPWLGVRYAMVNKTIAEENKLTVDYGAMIVRGEKITDLAVIPGSPADKAGLAENDIILEVNGQKIDKNYPLSGVISRFSPGDEIILKILHKGEEKEIKVKLEEMKE